LLEKAFKEASKLPSVEQNALAKWVLEELEAEKKWGKVFAESEDALDRLADEALEPGTVVQHAWTDELVKLDRRLFLTIPKIADYKERQEALRQLQTEYDALRENIGEHEKAQPAAANTALERFTRMATSPMGSQVNGCAARHQMGKPDGWGMPKDQAAVTSSPLSPQ